MLKHKTLTAIAAILNALASSVPLAQAEWPAHVFAPYIYANPGALEQAYNATGQKYFTLAFSTAVGQPRRRRPRPAGTNPATLPATAPASQPATAPNPNLGKPTLNGHLMSDHYLADDIAFIRAHGGDVIISFGGAAGTEIGMTDPDPAVVEARYQAVIDEYKLTWIDMDIEGGSINNKTLNHNRNTALANLQKKNPGLIVVYTLAADPHGLSPRGLETLRDAKEQGVKVDTVNLMTMDYGPDLSKGKKMGDLAVTTVESSYKQMQAIDPDMKIGITPDIGINDVKSEIFDLDDAKTEMEFARKTPYVRLLAFWVQQRDHGKGNVNQDTASGIEQDDWAFNKTFNPFTTGFTPPTK